MIEEKKRKMERKKAKKLKEMKKRGTIDMRAIQREVYMYQRQINKRPTWSQSCFTDGKRNSIDLREKGQHNDPPEVKG